MHDEHEHRDDAGDEDEAPSPHQLTLYALEGLLEHWDVGLRDVRSAPTWRLRAAAGHRFWWGLLMAQDHDVAAYGPPQERAWRDALTVFLAGLLLGHTAEEMRERLRREPPLIA